MTVGATHLSKLTKSDLAVLRSKHQKVNLSPTESLTPFVHANFISRQLQYETRMAALIGSCVFM
jgi:hypothetical protein